jgi:prepilin-type N-terminal cleavage/methylation domain-containing protein
LVKRSAAGFTLMEVVVTLAVFSIFLLIIVTVTAEMRRQEKKYPVNFMAHPEVGSVMARLRKDVLDAKYYPAEFQGYSQSQQTLLVYTLRQTGFGETVVYDFRTRGEVHRKAFNATQLSSDWMARGVPNFRVDAFTLGNGQDGVRITARDEQNRLAIDTILVPRPHN